METFDNLKGTEFESLPKSAKFRLRRDFAFEVVEYLVFALDKAYGQMKAKDARIAELEAALEQIRDNEGKVCELYEICEHESCQSSYNSWAIASQALEDTNDRA